MVRKKKKIVDPFASREAEKYQNPIPSREYIMQYLQEHAGPVRRDDLLLAFHLDDPEQQEALRRRLRAMERDGQLVFTRRGGYGLAEKMDLIRGRVIGHRDGFGFVVPDEGGDDLFLSAHQMRAVFNGDRVLVRVSGVDRRGRREGTIVEVLEHATTKLVGRLFEKNNVTYVIPDNKRIKQDILIPTEERGLAKQGQIVMVEIISPPTIRRQAIGRVTEVLGEHMAAGMEIDIAIRSYNLPHEWPEEVQKEIAKLKGEVKAADKKNRVDLTALPLVTIDGEDAKDFDDAVYCEPRKRGGWTLYVAIADVSHYVKYDTALDREAYARGNSVYFPGYVVPMLPEVLSNGLCSLKPEVDRLCLVCEIVISAKGKVTGYQFYRAVMCSQARLTYTEVARMVEDPKSARSKRDKQLLPHLQNLHELYEILRTNREIRGAIDFETTETRVIFGLQRKIEEIVPYERTVAHRIIEECMLLANVSAAEFIAKAKLPVLYRIHEGPKAEKLADVRTFLAELGLRLPGRKIPEPVDYAELLASVADRPDARLIQTVLLRSLSQAVYSPESVGHFGLAYSTYTHFTSPIRRYPDLILHRAIGKALTKGKEKYPYDEAAMMALGEHCSRTERRADEATRDVLDWLKCEFISDRLGEEFVGLITNVTSFGVFVELKDVYVEGLVHVTALANDYYHFDPIKRRLRGERSGISYHLGDTIKVRVARVDLDNRQIDFELVGANKKSSKKSKISSPKKVKPKTANNKVKKDKFKKRKRRQ